MGSVRPSRTFLPALLLAALCAPARAQAPSVDFDGRARGVSGEFVLPPHPQLSSAAPGADAEASGSVSFGGAVLPLRAFSRTDRIPDLLVKAIDQTKSTLLLALYELNLPGVADAPAIRDLLARRLEAYRDAGLGDGGLRSILERQPPGAGQGLDLLVHRFVQRAVDLHHGEIDVESEINKGTTIITKIPLTTEDKQK